MLDGFLARPLDRDVRRASATTKSGLSARSFELRPRAPLGDLELLQADTAGDDDVPVSDLHGDLPRDNGYGQRTDSTVASPSHLSLQDRGALAAGCLRLRPLERIIRRLVAADVETVVAFSLNAWAPVFASLEAELGSHTYCLLWPDWGSAQATALKPRVGRLRTMSRLPLVNDRPVGFVVVRWVDEDAARVGEISMIAVDPAHHNAGLGTSLMERAVTEIRARGVDLAVIATGGDAGHAPARALYEKFNFKPLPQVRSDLEL